MDSQDRTGSSPPPERDPPPTAPEDGDVSPEEIPLGQRLYDRPFLLLFLGLLVMLVFYTGWGLWEVVSLSEAPLP
jgi:hypothetical protein